METARNYGERDRDDDRGRRQAIKRRPAVPAARRLSGRGPVRPSSGPRRRAEDALRISDVFSETYGSESPAGDGVDMEDEFDVPDFLR